MCTCFSLGDICRTNFVNSFLVSEIHLGAYCLCLISFVLLLLFCLKHFFLQGRTQDLEIERCNYLGIAWHFLFCSVKENLRSAVADKEENVRMLFENETVFQQLIKENYVVGEEYTETQIPIKVKVFLQKGQWRIIKFC